MRLLLIPLLFLLLASAAGFAFGDRIALPDSFEEAVAWLRSFQGWAWAVAIGLIIGDVLLPLPSTPALVGLGILYGPVLGGVLGGLAMTAAGLLAFTLPRALGRRGVLWLVGERDLARAQRFYGRWGVIAVMLGRAIGGPAEWMVVIAGISGMAFRRVLLALGVGGFASAFVNAGLGALAVERPVLAIALVLLLALACAWLARRLLSDPAVPSSP